MNIDFTLWPNPDGELGVNKATIPTGIGDDTWPDGDALINNVVYKDGKISGFVDTKALTVNESKSTTFPYDCVNIEVDKSLEGVMTFNRGERTKYFTITYTGSSSGGSETFDFVIIDFATADQETIDTVRTAKRVVDNKLYDADDNLIGTIDTSKIEVGGIYDGGTGTADGLFCNIDTTTGVQRGFNLSEFNSDLSSLRNSFGMFAYCSDLTTFTSDLSNLTNGGSMFAMCTNLTTFNIDLSSLRNGLAMFVSCFELTSFSSDLSNLLTGDGMFSDCKLDTASVQNIAETINSNPPSGAMIHIDIGNSTPNEDEITAFQTIVAKGWRVYVNGSEYTWEEPVPHNLSDETTTETPIPFYAKPIEVEEDKAKYVGEDGKFYNILGAQFIYGDDLSTYGMFTCEEDAAFNMGLTKIEKENQYPSLPAFFNN